MVNNRKYQLVIFDLDGTIFNSYPAIIKSFNFTMRRIGLEEKNDYVIKRAVGWGDRALLFPFTGRKINKALRIYRKHHQRALLSGVCFMPYAEEVIKYLTNKKHTLAIATNRPAKFTNILLKAMRIKDNFNFVLCKDQIKFGKPHPSILNKIIRRFKVAKEKVLYVGDMALDIRTAKRAKVKAFAVATGSSTYKELKKENPAYISKSLKKLFSIL